MVQLDKDARLVGQSVGRGNPSPDFSLLGTALAWAEDAECARRCSDDLPIDQRMSFDDWFVSEYDVAATDAAVSVCEECPVAISCLRYALENHIEYGIWGGTTAHMRKSRGRRNRRLIRKKLGEDVG